MKLVITYEKFNCWSDVMDRYYSPNHWLYIDFRSLNPYLLRAYNVFSMLIYLKWLYGNLLLICLTEIYSLLTHIPNIILSLHTIVIFKPISRKQLDKGNNGKTIKKITKQDIQFWRLSNTNHTNIRECWQVHQYGKQILFHNRHPLCCSSRNKPGDTFNSVSRVR